MVFRPIKFRLLAHPLNDLLDFLIGFEYISELIYEVRKNLNYIAFKNVMCFFILGDLSFCFYPFFDHCNKRLKL